MTKAEMFQKRHDDLMHVLVERAPHIFDEQHHLDPETPEWAYWHYGYAVAMRDVLKQLSA